MTNLTQELVALARQMELSVEIIEHCYEAGLVKHPLFANTILILANYYSWL